MNHQHNERLNVHLAELTLYFLLDISRHFQFTYQELLCRR